VFQMIKTSFVEKDGGSRERVKRIVVAGRVQCDCGFRD